MPSRRAPALLFALVLATALVSALGGCASKSKTPPRSPDVEAKYQAAIARHEATFGMRRDEVEKAIGKPRRKDWVVVDGERRERWSYTFSEIQFDTEGYVVRILTP